jgi:hypothetical protein
VSALLWMGFVAWGARAALDYECCNWLRDVDNGVRCASYVRRQKFCNTAHHGHSES